MRAIRSKLDYVDTEYRVLAKLNGKTVGFIDKNLNGTYSYAFGRPKASYVSFNVDDLDTAKSRLEEHVFTGSSRRPLKSSKERILADLEDMDNEFAVVEYMKGFFDKNGRPELYDKFCDDVDTGYEKDGKLPAEVAAEYVEKIYNSRKPVKSALDTVKVTFANGDTIVTDYNADVGREEIARYYMGRYFDVGSYPRENMQKVVKVEFPNDIQSSRSIKSEYDSDYDYDAEELALYIENTSELYHGITHSAIENLKKKARKGEYDKNRAVDAWMYVADAGARMYDKELGSGRGSMTLFTKDERRKAAEKLARYYEDNVLEGIEGVQSAFKPITSANNYGWEVDSSDVPEALDLFVEYYGEETALEEIARAMDSDTLDENIEWIARHWGFAEELEGYDDAWDKYEYAKEVMGDSQLFNELTSAAGYDELAEDLAFIFRMYDFREWDKYDDDDEEIESSRRISSGKRTVDHKKPSREEIEKALDKRLAQEKVKFATDMYDDTVDYILSFWDEEDYIPKDADDAVSQWYNDTKKHFPQDLKKIASAAYRHWIRSKLIKSSRRIR